MASSSSPTTNEARIRDAKKSLFSTLKGIRSIEDPIPKVLAMALLRCGDMYFFSKDQAAYSGTDEVDLESPEWWEGKQKQYEDGRRNIRAFTDVLRISGLKVEDSAFEEWAEGLLLRLPLSDPKTGIFDPSEIVDDPHKLREKKGRGLRRLLPNSQWEHTHGRIQRAMRSWIS